MTDRTHERYEAVLRALARISGQKATLHVGSVQETIATLPENYFHACLCDPPYGIRFMCKGWDRLPTCEDWTAILRVLKPGASLLAFGSPRTHHRMMVEMEDAGFEIKDVLCWLYSSGVPKGKSVAKHVDKEADRDIPREKEIADYIRACREAKGLYRGWVDQEVFGAAGRMAFIEGRIDWKSRFQIYLPPWEEWVKLKKVLGLDDRHDDYIRDVIPSRAMRQKLDGGKAVTVDNPGVYTYQKDGSPNCGRRVTAPRRPEALLWNGYDVALKPSWEPIVLAMKPFEFTMGRNALDHGVSGLNIAAARVNGLWPANTITGNGVVPEMDRYCFHPKADQAERTDAGVRNPHPAIKPLSLCKYLARLLLPPIAPRKLLVPFAGSGSEVIGALQAEWEEVVGIEAEAKFVDVAARRICSYGWTVEKPK